MEYAGILVAGGGLICLVLLCVTIVRFKELRLQRVLGILEWLVTNVPPPVSHRNQDDSFLEGDLGVHRAWHLAQFLFELPLRGYVRLVWNANSQDLYWANRFGAELYRLSLFPLPPDPERRRAPGEEERRQIVATHVRDFVLIAHRLLQTIGERERHVHE